MLTTSTTSMKSKAMTESPILWLGNNQYATFYLGQIENSITTLLYVPLFVLWLNIDFSLNASKRWGRTGLGRATIEIEIEIKIGIALISKWNENWNCADFKIRLEGEGVRPRRAPRDNLTNCPGPLSSLPQQRNYKSQELSFSLLEGSLGSCDAVYIGVLKVLITLHALSQLSLDSRAGQCNNHKHKSRA